MSEIYNEILKVSIIIPTYNSEKTLEELLLSIKAQDIRDYELIIIDSSSLDNTVAIAKRYTDKVLIINQCDFDHGGTRTLGAKQSSGDILIFLTQDTILLDQHSLHNLINSFRNSKIGAAYGRQIPYEDTHIFGKFIRLFNYPSFSVEKFLCDKETFGIKTAFLSDSYAAYRKESLERVGWFKNNLILGEDTYVGGKLILMGYGIAYVSEATVYHSHSYSSIEEFRRYFDIGVFHRCEDWILKEFGRAEGEGLNYIRKEIAFIIKHKKFHYLFIQILRTFCKYLGYKLGYNYNFLPYKFVIKLSMHGSWWKKNDNNNINNNDK